MHIKSLAAVFFVSEHCHASVLFAADYDVVGFGATDAVIFSSDFFVDRVSAITSLEVELSNTYAGELVLTLTSPTGDTFSILENNGLRTRLGAGDTLLEGVELYTFVDPTQAALKVVDWDFTGYQSGGTYGAKEWAIGEWEAGTWNLTLRNEDIASASTGVVGSVKLNGEPIPEPSCVLLLSIGSGIGMAWRRRAA